MDGTLFFSAANDVGVYEGLANIKHLPPELQSETKKLGKNRQFLMFILTCISLSF